MAKRGRRCERNRAQSSAIHLCDHLQRVRLAPLRLRQVALPRPRKARGLGRRMPRLAFQATAFRLSSSLGGSEDLLGAGDSLRCTSPDERVWKHA